MATDPLCPCDGGPGERTIVNAPAQSRIAYRVGDFRSFRRALLSTPPKPFDQEQQLKDWRPSAADDLGMQMLEWWAYLGDILTFYNERIANESYLRTATQAENLRRLIRTLGYRPRPGVAAHGVLAALVGAHQPLTLPKGFPVDSRPGPGEQPQAFELDADAIVRPHGVITAEPPAYAFPQGATRFLVRGPNPPFKAGANLMLASRNASSPPLLLMVSDLRQETGTDGAVYTSVDFSSAAKPPERERANDLLLLQAMQCMPSSSINSSAISTSGVDLAGLVRDLRNGDYVLLVGPGDWRALHQVKSVTEVVWYANYKASSIVIGEGGGGISVYGPTIPPDPPTVPIVVTHSCIEFTDTLPSGWPNTLGATTISYGWRSAGQLLDQPMSIYAGGALEARAPAAFPTDGKCAILIADAAGAGAAGAGLSTDGKSLTVSNLPAAMALMTPLTVHYNLLAVSRGKTVVSEMLGSGNASVAGQSFVLKKKPLTYLAKGDSVVSTLRVWVDAREWKEAPSFYGQPPDAEIFVTREDDDQKTHVMFGDGENGARLPSGVDNVIASYRYGSGAKSPPAGALTVIGRPYPNLKSLKNPVAVGGGADPDPAGKIRRLAPRSAVTFGRAISGDDYQAIAAQAPGVVRTRAVWSFDADEQRSAVTIYVGDDAAALNSAKAAIAAAADPLRRVVIAQATPIPVSLSLHLLVDRGAIAAEVAAKVAAALIDDDAGLFGARRLGIGEAVFDSQIHAACIGVPGVTAVHGIVFAVDEIPQTAARHVPDEGAFFSLKAEQLTIAAEAA